MTETITSVYNGKIFNKKGIKDGKEWEQFKIPLDTGGEYKTNVWIFNSCKGFELLTEDNIGSTITIEFDLIDFDYKGTPKKLKQARVITLSGDTTIPTETGKPMPISTFATKYFAKCKDKYDIYDFIHTYAKLGVRDKVNLPFKPTLIEQLKTEYEVQRPDNGNETIE